MNCWWVRGGIRKVGGELLVGRRRGGLGRWGVNCWWVGGGGD